MIQDDARAIERRETPPFLLKIFYRTGAFHRPDEFATHLLPPHLNIHTWQSATLAEITHHIANHWPSLLPTPAIGTRLAFRLVYRDANASFRFVVKDMGSVVLGGKVGSGSSGDSAADVDPADVDMHDDDAPDQGSSPNAKAKVAAASSAAAAAEPDEAQKTLGDVKFIVGDYISCAILPPLDDGSVAPASSARSGRGSGVGEASPWDDGARPFPRAGQARQDRFFDPGRRGGSRSGRFESDEIGRSNIPLGEWRRGERLPDGPVGGGAGGRGNGGWSRNKGRW